MSKKSGIKTQIDYYCIYINYPEMKKRLFTMALILSAFLAHAQQTPVTDDKAAREAKQKQEYEFRFHNDWANLARYADENSKLASTATGENRVVFMGNSITEFWKMSDSVYFSNNYICRGISGQTTPQMLVRFREDVINLKPNLVVILAGINDIAQNTGPEKLEDVFGNIVSMVQLAKASHIKVVMSSVLPANHFPWRPSIDPTEKVIQLNKMIKDYADQNQIVYLDYYSAMVDDKKGLPKNLSNDGVHPTIAGYKIMEPLADKAIAEALKRAE